MNVRDVNANRVLVRNLQSSWFNLQTAVVLFNLELNQATTWEHKAIDHYNQMRESANTSDKDKKKAEQTLTESQKT